MNAPKGATVTGATTGTKFEEGAEPSAATTETSAPAAAPAAAAPAAAPAAPASAIALSVKSALAASAGALEDMDIVSMHKDKLRVEWNTLDRIQASNGNFMDKGKGSGVSMGDQIQLRLVSWQDSYQVSPGSDDAEAKQYVRYSDNGKTLSDGSSIAEYVQRLKTELGYPKAACDHRVVIAGVLEATTKETRLAGGLVQIDLSKTSRSEFDKYRVGTAFKIGKGLLKPEHAMLMTMTAEVAAANGKEWTLVRFEPTTE